MTPFRVICVDDSVKYCKCGNIHRNKIQPVISGCICEVEDIVYGMCGEACYKLVGFTQIKQICRFRRLDEYTDATADILKDFNPDKVEQEIVNPVKVEI